jgi:hypothetical protein
VGSLFVHPEQGESQDDIGLLGLQLKSRQPLPDSVCHGSGIYFVRCRSADHTAIARFVIAR